MKFISAAPVLFTTTFLVWNATPALSAKVEASATINDKDADIYTVDNKSSRSLQSIGCTDSPLDWYDNRVSRDEHDCVWYSKGSRCEEYGDDYANDGKTANEACCACGGGEYFAFTTKVELREAVDKYCNDPDAWKNKKAFKKYGPIENWNVSKIVDMSFLFNSKGYCNPDIGKWNVGKVTSFESIFFYASSFNQDIGGWDVSSGTSFESMFVGASSFNQDIGGWDVSSGTEFRGMFRSARSFNQDIGGWDVSSGTEFEGMFFGASSFNQDIGAWDVSSGTSFKGMFFDASSFNQDIGEWDVSSGTDFYGMFGFASSFNQDIGGWDVSSGIDFEYMFYGASAFNQDLCNWEFKSDAMKHEICIDAVSCGDCTF